MLKLFLTRNIEPRQTLITLQSLKNIDPHYEEETLQLPTLPDNPENLTPRQKFEFHMYRTMVGSYIFKFYSNSPKYHHLLVKNFNYQRQENCDNDEKFDLEFDKFHPNQRNSTDLKMLKTLGFSEDFQLAIQYATQIKLNREDLNLLFIELAIIYSWFWSFKHYQGYEMQTAKDIQKSLNYFVLYLIKEVIPKFPFSEERELNLIIQINSFLKRVLSARSDPCFPFETQIELYCNYYQFFTSSKLEHVFISSFEQYINVIIFFCKNLVRRLHHTGRIFKDSQSLLKANEILPVRVKERQISRNVQIFTMMGFFEYIENFINKVYQNLDMSSEFQEDQNQFQRKTILSYYIQIFEAIEKMYFFGKTEFDSIYIKFIKHLGNVDFDNCDIDFLSRAAMVMASFQTHSEQIDTGRVILDKILVSILKKLKSNIFFRRILKKLLLTDSLL